ncbi:hypothetical protein RchiOBHm_Chr6g0266831 [Rosa chinensis]|uniref:Uncharacterized protein n=1 Tax=Rosa chinensis TaxID=74649 RepID=A0A2P6PPT2_ROSCH|nr:hypothetical protein RchiOBHm_Chr6g0266831 [Rosa chinensis]
MDGCFRELKKKKLLPKQEYLWYCTICLLQTFVRLKFHIRWLLYCLLSNAGSE